MSETKTDKELAIDLTIELIKVRGNVIASIDDPLAKSNKINDWLKTSEVKRTFEEIYSTIQGGK